MIRLYNFHSGKKVNFLEHLLINIDLGIGAMELAATKGSIGIIISYEEYRDHAKTLWFPSVDHLQDHLWWARTEMWAGTYYPVKFEEYVSPSDEEFAQWNTYITHLSIRCKVGDINLLPAGSFVFI